MSNNRDYMSLASFTDYTWFVGQDKLLNSLEGLSEDLKNKLGEEILRKAGEIYIQEEKRILAQKYPGSKLLNLLTIWTKDTKYGKQINAGYPRIVVETYPECLVIEFGRPACETAGERTSKLDSLGRKIGYVEPHSHIRAAIFLKKDAVKTEIKRLIEHELKERFGVN